MAAILILVSTCDSVCETLTLSSEIGLQVNGDQAGILCWFFHTMVQDV